jgi:hypothetical protein
MYSPMLGPPDPSRLSETSFRPLAQAIAVHRQLDLARSLPESNSALNFKPRTMQHAIVQHPCRATPLFKGGTVR